MTDASPKRATPKPAPDAKAGKSKDAATSKGDDRFNPLAPPINIGAGS